MKLIVLTLFSVTLAAADSAQDGVTDESGSRHGIYETNYRGAYQPEYVPDRHPEYAPERQIEYAPVQKVVEDVNYGHPGYYGQVVNPNYEYRRYGREGLGFDRRTAYALGLRYPVTPKILETVYRGVYHDSRYSLQL